MQDPLAVNNKICLPTETIDLLRDGLRGQLATAAQELTYADELAGGSEHPERYQGPLRSIDALRALLEEIGWSGPPSEVSVDLRLHSRALMLALEDQLSGQDGTVARQRPRRCPTRGDHTQHKRPDRTRARDPAENPSACPAQPKLSGGAPAGLLRLAVVPRPFAIADPGDLTDLAERAPLVRAEPRQRRQQLDRRTAIRIAASSIAACTTRPERPLRCRRSRSRAARTRAPRESARRAAAPPAGSPRARSRPRRTRSPPAGNRWPSR